ncbi:MAG: hypothetical protein HY722_09015 [Planctomycetes bacterium]|nr:hypothetical protein [Planctomycetota bacterium]
MYRFAWLLWAASGCTLAGGGPPMGRAATEYRIALVGTGWAAPEAFLEAARRVEAACEATAPFDHYRPVWVHRSAELRPFRPAGRPSRMLDVEAGPAWAAAEGTGARCVLVLVAGRTGGAGGAGLAVIGAMDPSFPAGAVHELGHAVGGLQDEYGGPPGPACIMRSTREARFCQACRQVLAGALARGAAVTLEGR